MKDLAPWTVTGECLLHDGSPWLQLFEQSLALPDGQEVEAYFRVAMRDFAIMYVTTPADDVLTLRLYRHGPRRVERALPGGFIDDGGEPLEAAQRELLEETGFRASDWSSLGSYVMNSNYGCGRCYAFMASGAEQVAEPDSGDPEDAELCLIPRKRLLQHLRDGDIGIMGHASVIALAQVLGANAPVRTGH
ncbi:MAG: NUDIX hydrolase [Rhodospirillaceae bacterium]|nr:NUDIX hydrolase [Rhodospirillaceae bacterium]